VLLAFDRPLVDGEFPLIHVGIDYSDWVAQGTPWEASYADSMVRRGYPIAPTRQIATSVEEFLERALEFMIAHELGFGYWHEPPENDDLW
jgi:hypothetical protein